MIIVNPYPQHQIHRMSEVAQISIQTTDPDSYDYSWITDEILAVCRCDDGIIVWFYKERVAKNP